MRHEGVTDTHAVRRRRTSRRWHTHIPSRICSAVADGLDVELAISGRRAASTDPCHVDKSHKMTPRHKRSRPDRVCPWSKRTVSSPRARAWPAATAAVNVSSSLNMTWSSSTVWTRMPRGISETLNHESSMDEASQVQRERRAAASGRGR
eukprot:6402148-Prymnesium_polylepis.1